MKGFLVEGSDYEPDEDLSEKGSSESECGASEVRDSENEEQEWESTSESSDDEQSDDRGNTTEREGTEVEENEDQYSTARRFTYLRKVEHDLSHGLLETVGGLVHVNGNHYIAFVLDASACSIKLGDPMGKSPPERVSRALSWWLKLAVGKSGAESGDAEDATHIDVPVDFLPVASQRDNHSCALLSLNALMHHYDPDKASLMNGGEKNTLVLERMSCAHRVLALHAQYVGLCIMEKDVSLIFFRILDFQGYARSLRWPSRRLRIQLLLPRPY